MRETENNHVYSCKCDDCRAIRDSAESAWQDQTARHLEDQELRAAGFKIHARPKSGPAIWTRKGKQFTEAEALATFGSAASN